MTECIKINTSPPNRVLKIKHLKRVIIKEFKKELLDKIEKLPRKDFKKGMFTNSQDIGRYVKLEDLRQLIYKIE